MKVFATICVLGALVCALATAAVAGPITLVENGKSAYSIYRDPLAPGTVKTAAFELQRVIEAATGAKIPIKMTPSSPMICLGVHATSQAAGLDKDLPEIGFRIVTKGNDVFILGNDTADNKEQWAGQARKGTLLGTYEFLERVANARWLMPGEVGEDVPKTQRLVVPDMSVQEMPTFQLRWYIGLQDKRREVIEWRNRNKADSRTGGGQGVNWSHSFNSCPTNSVLQAHPEFMAMKKDGSRQPVPRPGAGHVMYCLSNPQFYDAFADEIMAWFAKYPKSYSMSMSPDEGAAWCECPECSRLNQEILPKWKDLGARPPQKTALVLRFYNEVAKRVRAKYPDRVLGGFIYQDYLMPLEEPIKMEPNIVLGLAINSGYGFKFYQPARQAIVQQLFDEWARYDVPLGYYSYDTWMRNWFGLPLPPSRSLLKWNFQVLKQNHVQHLQYVGMEAWGYAAAHNWMVAKLMWNADSDVDALYNEFLTRAYGPEAAPLIDRMYELIDGQLQRYVRETQYPDHEIDYATTKAIYAPIYPEIERLYLEALGKPMTDRQRKRLQMLGDNLVMANFNMRKARLLPEEEAKKSPLYLYSIDYLEEFIEEKEKTFSIIPVSEWVRTYGYPDMPILREGWRPK